MKTQLPKIIALLLSVAMVVTGIVLVTQGLSAKAQVTDELAAEHITTTEDSAIPNVAVDSAATAKAQADIIHHHALASSNGKTYAEMDREDPARATYLSSVTLRTSLMSAYMAFKLADLVTGLGALFLALGLGGGVASGIALSNRDEATVDTKARAAKQTVTA